MTSQTRTKQTRIFIASLAVLGVMGCSLSDSGGPGEPDDPGLLLVPAGQNGYWPPELVWTRDGTELVYAENGLNAVTTTTRIVRRLDASPSITSLARGDGGERIYFGAFVPTTPGSMEPNLRVTRLHPVSGGTEIVITTVPGAYQIVAVSSDERFLVAGPRLFDLQTAASIDLPAGIPVAFSPDGTRLLYYLTGNATVSPTLISTADGSSQTLYSAGNYVAHRWEGNSPQLLSADFAFSGGGIAGLLSETDGLTGVTRDVAQLSTTTSSVSANWSPDGRIIGIWVEQGSRTNLYRIRSGSAAEIVASLTTRLEAGPGPPGFSPSGSSVAYFYYEDTRRSLYLKSGI